MARWGLIPFWMKEKPKVPHINARAETVHKLPLFREALLNGDVSFRRRDFTSGRSAKMASSLIASAVKTSNLSPSQECGSSLGWAARTFYPLQLSLEKQTHLSVRCMIVCPSC